MIWLRGNDGNCSVGPCRNGSGTNIQWAVRYWETDYSVGVGIYNRDHFTFCPDRHCWLRAGVVVMAYWAVWRWTRSLLLGYVSRRWERRLRKATGEPIELWHDVSRWAFGWSAWLLWDNSAERSDEVRAVGQLIEPPGYYVGQGETPRKAIADLQRQLVIDNREWMDEEERMKRIVDILAEVVR